MAGEELNSRSGSSFPDVQHMTATSFHFLINLCLNSKQIFMYFQCRKIIYKTLPDSLSFKQFCEQLWRLIRATLISRNSACASWMPLLWLQDSMSGTEAPFIRNKPERFMEVPSLPVAGEWPWLNSLWWHWQFIIWLFPARCSFRVTCPSQLRTFSCGSSSKGLCSTHQYKRALPQQCLLLLLQGWLQLFSKQLAPAREQLESCKCMAELLPQKLACRGHWHKGGKSPPIFVSNAFPCSGKGSLHFPSPSRCQKHSRPVGDINRCCNTFSPNVF